MIDSSLFSVVLFRIIKDIHTTTTTLVAVAVFFFFFCFSIVFRSGGSSEYINRKRLLSWVRLRSHGSHSHNQNPRTHKTQLAPLLFITTRNNIFAVALNFVYFVDFALLHDSNLYNSTNSCIYIYIYCFIACFFALGADRYGREWIECVLCCVLVLVRYRERMREWDGRLTKANAAPRKKWFVTKNKKNNKKNKV